MFLSLILLLLSSEIKPFKPLPLKNLIKKFSNRSPWWCPNKIFLISIERNQVETSQEDKKINSICKFDFIDHVKSKNIDQSDKELILELIGIDYLKNKDNYEINLMFNSNAHISLRTETIEVSLEDQSEIK